ncbi:hypothetical protein Hanom_Chr04g00341591 [Helianthus anomalus]
MRGGWVQVGTHEEKNRRTNHHENRRTNHHESLIARYRRGFFVLGTQWREIDIDTCIECSAYKRLKGETCLCGPREAFSSGWFKGNGFVA